MTDLHTEDTTTLETGESASNPLKEISELLGGAPQAEEQLGGVGDDTEQELVEGEEDDSTQEAEENETSDEQAEAEDGEAEEGDSDNSVEGEISTVKDFVAASGWDMEDFYGLKMKLSDGAEVPLGEIKDKLQEIPQKQAALETEVTNFNAHKKQWETNAATAMNTVSAISEEMLSAEGDIRALVQQYNSVDWDKFESQDAGRAALARQRLEEAFRTATAKKEQAKVNHQQGQQQLYKQHLAGEAQALIAKVPEWKQPQVFAEKMSQMDKLMNEFGYPLGTAPNISDHRQLLMMNELVTLRARVGDAKEGLKESLKRKKPMKVIKRGMNSDAKKRFKNKAANDQLRKVAEGNDNRAKASLINSLIQQ